jgi:hypothetical protein
MFRPTIILTADACRARMFRVHDDDSPSRVPQLVEVSSLMIGSWVPPSARMQRLTRNALPSSHRPSVGQPATDARDHTDDNSEAFIEEEARRRFAKQVAETLQDLAQSPCRVVACTTHTMLKLLSDAVERNCRHAHVAWLNAEFTRLSPRQLAETLIAKGHLSPSPRN